MEKLSQQVVVYVVTQAHVGGGTPVYISAPQRTSCVTLGEFFSISVPVFLHLENEDANSTTSQGGVRMDEAEGSAPAECSTAHERGLFS